MALIAISVWQWRNENRAMAFRKQYPIEGEPHWFWDIAVMRGGTIFIGLTGGGLVILSLWNSFRALL